MVRRMVIGLCVIVAICAAAIQFFFPHFFPAIVASVAMPFWRVELAVQGDSLRTPDALLRENEKLRLLLDDAEIRLATVGAIESENRELKAYFGRETATSSDAWAPVSGRILAAVLERPPLSAYDILVIDIGTSHGLKEGDRIYAPGNVLIGRVADVLGRTSKVVLYSSPGESQSVLIGPASVPATATGRGGGHYEARVPQGTAVSEGDFVNAPSLSDRPFGRVVATGADPAQPFDTVLIAPPVNLYQLKWVLVEKVQ